MSTLFSKKITTESACINIHFREFERINIHFVICCQKLSSFCNLKIRLRRAGEARQGGAEFSFMKNKNSFAKKKGALRGKEIKLAGLCKEKKERERRKESYQNLNSVRGLYHFCEEI